MTTKKKVTIEQVIAVFPDTRHTSVYKVLSFMNSMNTDFAVNNDVIWDCAHDHLMSLHGVIDTVIWNFLSRSPLWEDRKDVLIEILSSKTYNNTNTSHNRSTWRKFVETCFQAVMMKLSNLSKKRSAIIKSLCSKHDLELGSVLFIIIDDCSSLVLCNGFWYILSQDKNHKKPCEVTQLTGVKKEEEEMINVHQ